MTVGVVIVVTLLGVCSGFERICLNLCSLCLFSAVWLQMMLPLLNVRNLNHYVVQYLETLFRFVDLFGIWNLHVVTRFVALRKRLKFGIFAVPIGTLLRTSVAE